MAAAAMPVVANARSVASILTSTDGFHLSRAGMELHSPLNYKSLEHEFRRQRRLKVKDDTATSRNVQAMNDLHASQRRDEDAIFSEEEFCTPAGASSLESNLQNEVYADRDVDVMCGCLDGFAECSVTFNEEECEVLSCSDGRWNCLDPDASSVSVCTIERIITTWLLLDDIAPSLFLIQSTTEYTSGVANIHKTSALISVIEEEEPECLMFNVDRSQKKVTSKMLCAKEDGKDSCQGDSGGPLLIKGADSSQDLQIGVVSWGVGCGEDGAYPSVYARVSSVYEWIRAQVCKGSVDPPASFECNESAADDTVRSGHAKQERIVGGEDAKVGRFQYAVGLAYPLFGQFCGGSLIAPDVVLSAAHCMNTADFVVPYNVIIGRHDLEEQTEGESIAMSDEVKHPNYDLLSLENDFALVFLASPTYNYEVVQLNQDDNIPQSGDPVTAIGYGDTDPDVTVMTPSMILQEVEKKALSNEECNEIPEWENFNGQACNSCEVCEQDGSSVKVKADCDNLFPTTGQTWDCNNKIDFTSSLLQLGKYPDGYTPPPNRSPTPKPSSPPFPAESICSSEDAFALKMALSEVMPDGDIANIDCNCQSDTGLVLCDVEFLEEICVDGFPLCWKSSQVQLWNVATFDLKSVTYKSEYTQGALFVTSDSFTIENPQTNDATCSGYYVNGEQCSSCTLCSGVEEISTVGDCSNIIPFADGSCDDAALFLGLILFWEGDGSSAIIPPPTLHPTRTSQPTEQDSLEFLSTPLSSGPTLSPELQTVITTSPTSSPTNIKPAELTTSPTSSPTNLKPSAELAEEAMLTSPTLSPINIKPIFGAIAEDVVASTSTSEQRACRTMAECDARRQELGVESFLASTNLPFKGCFMEEGESYFGLGGSEEDISAEILEGTAEEMSTDPSRERLFCTNDNPGTNTSSAGTVSSSVASTVVSVTVVSTMMMYEVLH